MTKRVFLGGTCNESSWRAIVKEKLTIDFFDPVVDDWTEECMAEEIRQRKCCDICLYVITPKMTGVYAIAEVIDDSNKRPEKTVFCFIEKDGGDTFTFARVKSLTQAGRMVKENGGQFFLSLADTIEYLNR